MPPNLARQRAEITIPETGAFCQVFSTKKVKFFPSSAAVSKQVP
jgi:hypothetical protein